MTLRKAVFWVHLACGVVAGLVILMMSVTGVVLTYQKQMTEWSDRAYWVAPAVEEVRAPLSEVVRRAEAWVRTNDDDAEARVSGLVLWSDPEAPVAATLGGGRSLYLDPSTAEIRGESTIGVRAFLSWNVRMHRWFGASGERRAVARAVTGWSNLVFLVLVLSGLYLWIPARWTAQHVRPVLLFNRAARGRARDFNWHHVFGFWLAIPLAVVVASATVISFPRASDLAYRLAGDVPPTRGAATRPQAPRSDGMAGASLGTGGGVSEPAASFDVRDLDALAEPAGARVEGWRTLTVSIPELAGEPVDVRIDRGWGGAPQKRHTVRYDARTGEELAFESFADQSRGRRFRTFLRFAHTGEYFGVLGQTLAGLASLAGVVLVWTGLALAWRRLVLLPLRRRAARAG
jgi:uncharacterized iron-regulated membrane protein